MWNGLSQSVQSINSLEKFKKEVSNKAECNVLYYYGQRWSNIYHARLRIGCSKLKYDLYTSLHVIDSPFCECGLGIENAYHYLMECPFYNNERTLCRNAIMNICDFDFKTLLHGNDNLSLVENRLVFDTIHRIFMDTRRFD